MLSAESLDAFDMVCDFKALKLAVGEYLDAFDHALAVNSADPALDRRRGEDESGTATGGRLIVFENEDPTTEELARRIFEHVERRLAEGGRLVDDRGMSFPLRAGVRGERVRVGETSSSWAEYGVS